MRAGALERAAVVALGLYLTGTGGAAIWRGHWLYTDYLGLRVPSLLALATGLSLLVLGTACWGRLPCVH